MGKFKIFTFYIRTNTSFLVPAQMVIRDVNNVAQDPRTVAVPILDEYGGMIVGREGIPLATTLYEQQRGEEHESLPPMKAVVIHKAGGTF